MTARHRTLTQAWGLAAVIGVGAPAFAQETPPAKTEPTLFQQVIPQPTGKNGYEELVRAADAFRASHYFEQAQGAETTLAFKRQVLADPPVARALKLLREGLLLPISSPRQKLTVSTTLPELAGFRSLGRLLALQQYVFLADGRVPDALANARLGLRFSQAIQTDNLISGLVGIAVSTRCLQPLASHLDQLSAPDCATLYQICLEWLAQPDPEIAIIAAEQHWMRDWVEELRRQVDQPAGPVAAKPDGLDEALPESLQRELPTTPAALDTLFPQVEKRMDDQFQLSLQELQRPPWERRLAVPEEAGLASRIAASLVPDYGHVDASYTREAARIRLLACHCAIHRYQWEYDRLPPNLTVLNLGDLAIDPFTGQALHYAPLGSRYTLTSAGPSAAPDDLNAVNGRLPVSLTPGE